MQYYVFDARYITDKNINPMFASNDKQEAVTAANEIGHGTVVVRIDESGLREIVFTSSYKSDLGLSE